MKTDLYTKAILTIIAVFLGILVFQNVNIVTPAQAAPPAPAIAAQTKDIVNVNIVQIDGHPVYYKLYSGKAYQIVSTYD